MTVEGKLVVLGTVREQSASLSPSSASIQGDDSRVPYRTELFLDNQMLESTPGVSRRLHPAKKHLLNPVIRCDRWCDGTYLQPYTTMYDDEEQLFKMWARAGSDANAGYVGGNAAYMLYFTSADGVHWDKPDLGVMDVAGRRVHNTRIIRNPTRKRGNTREFLAYASGYDCAVF